MLTGVHNIDQATLATLYRFSIESGGNIMIFGAAGCGKTEMAVQAAASKNREHVYLNLSVLEAPDLMGLPMIDPETKLSEYATPRFLPLKGSRPQGVVLIVDEIDKRKPELQNPMLELFQFRARHHFITAIEDFHVGCSFALTTRSPSRLCQGRRV